MRTILHSLIIVSCFIALSCDSHSPSKPFIEKMIIVARKETVKIKQLELVITNNGCGRKWVSEGDNPAYEQAYCELVIKYKDSIIQAGDDFDPIRVGDIEITIDKMNPWGREEDSVPPGGCRLWLRRVLKNDPG